MRELDCQTLARSIALPPWYRTERLRTLVQIRALPLAERILAGHSGILRDLFETIWSYMWAYGSEIAARAPECASVERAVRDQATLCLIRARREALRGIEGSHAELWLRLACAHGVDLGAPKAATPALTQLLNALTAVELPDFYIGLTTMQMIAWALSTIALDTERYARGERRWFDAHAGGSPSHEEMYLWMALALLANSGIQELQSHFSTRARYIISPLFTNVAKELCAGH